MTYDTRANGPTFKIGPPAPHDGPLPHEEDPVAVAMDKDAEQIGAKVRQISASGFEPTPAPIARFAKRQVTIDGVTVFVRRVGLRWRSVCPFCTEPDGETMSIGRGDYGTEWTGAETYCCYICGKMGVLEGTPESRAMYAAEMMNAMPEWADVGKYAAWVGQRYRIDPERLRESVHSEP